MPEALVSLSSSALQARFVAESLQCSYVRPGRTDPIPLPVKMDGLGLGKANIETRMLDDAITKRPKVLDSQKIAEETEAQRQAREVSWSRTLASHSQSSCACAEVT